MLETMWHLDTIPMNNFGFASHLQFSRCSEGKKSEKSNWMEIEAIGGTQRHCEMGLKASDVTEVGWLQGIRLFCEHKRCSRGSAIVATLRSSFADLFTDSRQSLVPSALALHSHATINTIWLAFLTYFNPQKLFGSALLHFCVFFPFSLAFPSLFDSIHHWTSTWLRFLLLIHTLMPFPN